MNALSAMAALLLPCCMLAAQLTAPAPPAAGASALLLASGLPFILIRPNGRIALASRSARLLLGLSAGSGNILSLTAGTEAHHALRRAINHPFERSENFRAAFPGTGGATRLYCMESSPMGEGEGTGVVLRDITCTDSCAPAAIEVVRLAASARSMAGPLSVLSGWLETARETEGVLSPAVLRAMERQVKQLKAISSELAEKQFSAPTHFLKGEFDLGTIVQDAADRLASHLLLGEFDLIPVVQVAADRLAPRMVETGSRLDFHYSETPFMLRGDSLLWQQIVGELLGSTLHEDAPRQLLFTAQRSPRRAVVELVSDGPATWESTPEGCNRLELVRAAVRAQRGEFDCELSSPHATRYRLSFPV